MALSTVRHHLSDPDDVPKHKFSDLLPIYILYNTSFNILKAQYGSLPSNSQIDSMLSAPPPWNLHVDRPVETPQTVGYSTFIMLSE